MDNNIITKQQLNSCWFEKKKKNCPRHTISFAILIWFELNKPTFHEMLIFLKCQTWIRAHKDSGLVLRMKWEEMKYIRLSFRLHFLGKVTYISQSSKQSQEMRGNHTKFQFLKNLSDKPLFLQWYLRNTESNAWFQEFQRNSNRGNSWLIPNIKLPLGDGETQLQDHIKSWWEEQRLWRFSVLHEVRKLVNRI